MIDMNEHMTRVETKLDVLAEQWDKHVRLLQWMAGIGFTWLTILLTLYKFV
jgi:hypothetical protein